MKPKFRSNPFLRPANRPIASLTYAAGFGLALCVAGLSSSARADSAVWNGATGSAQTLDWNNTANWTPNTTFPNGVGEIATVTKDLTVGNTIINLNQPITVGTLLIGDIASSNTYTIASAAIANPAFNLIFDNTGSTNAVLTDAPTSGTNRTDIISTDISLQDSLDVSVTLNSLQLSGIISESSAGKAITKTGTGMLVLSGINTYTGTTTIESGTLRMTGPSPSIFGAGTSPIALGNATSISSNLSPTLQLNTDLTNPVTRAITAGASNSPTTGVYTINTNNGATGVSISGNITLNQNLTVSGNTTGGFTLAGNITTGSSGTRTLTITGTAASGGYTASGVIGGGLGTLALVKSGSTTLTLSGTNTFTGGTSLGGGTVIINSDAALGTAPASPTTNLTFTATSTLRGDAAISAVTLDANRNIVINTGVTAAFNAGAAANVLTINGVISNQTNTGILNLSTSATASTTGTVVLTGSNNFAVDSVINLGGGSNIGGGILRLANSNALGSNAIVINGNAGGGNALGETAVELSGGVTIGSNVTYNLAGHGNPGLAVADNFRNFSGNNTFNGAIRITTTGGGYQFDSAESGSLLTLGGSINNTLNSTRTLNFTGAGNTLISGTFAEAGGTSSKFTLVKYGTGALTLPGANAFTGGFTLNAGTVNLNSATALGTAGTLTIAGGIIDNTSGAAKTLTSNQAQVWNGDFAFGTSVGTNANDLSLGSGAVSLGTTAGTTRTITVNGGGWFTVAGIISNGTNATTPTNSIIKTGTGTLKLDGANTYSGGTTLQSGPLHLTSSSALGTGPLAINGGGLVARGASRTISNPVTVGADFFLGLATFNNQMNFSGTVDLGGATRTITVVDNIVAQDSILSGVISNGGLTKSGAGTLVLSAANTYAGPTSINQGTLLLNNGTPLDSTSSVTINGSGAKLIVDGLGTLLVPVTLTQGGIDGNGTLPSLTVANDIGNTVAAGDGSMTSLNVGSLTFQGAATLNLSNSDASNVQKLVVTNLATNASTVVVVNATSSGPWMDNVDYPLIEYTNYPSAANAAHFSLTPLTGLNPSQHASLVNTGAAIVLRITTDALLWTGAQNADWTTVPVGGLMNWKDNGNPVEYTNSRAVTFDDTSGVYGVNLAGNVSPPAVIFNADFFDYTVSSTGGSGIMAGSLTKNGFAKATITTNNSYTGSTIINNGTLEISGSIASSSSISITNPGMLAFDFASSPNVYANPITGSGSVTKNGTGALTLTGANTFTGSLTLNAGTLNINAASAWGGAGTGALVINGGTLDNTSGGVIAATTNKPQTWNADFPFAGSNNLDMGTGTVTLGGTGDRSVVVGGPGDILTVGEIKSSSQGLAISGGGTLVATSTGSFGAASSIGGTLTVGSGTTLQINRSTGNSDTTTGDFVATGLAGTGTITNGAAISERSLQINNFADFSFGGTIADGGAAKLALNKQGAGTLSLTGTNTYTGPTVIGGGILNVRTSNALGSSAVRSVSRNGGIQLQNNISLPSTVTFTLSNDGTSGATVPYAIGNVSGNNTINGLITLTSGGGGSIIQSDSGTLTLAGNITSDQPRPLLLQGASAGANTVSGIYSNGTSGVNTLTKAGPGLWILTGANTYTGATTINEGILQLGNGTTDGTIANTSSVINNATLVYNWTTNHTAGYVISGNGSVTKNGAGTAALTGVNTYTGTTTVNAGELAVNGTSIANTGTVVINGGKVNLTGTETVDRLFFGGVQQPAGSYTAAGDSTHFSGAGTLIVTSPSGFSSWASANGATGQTPSDDHDKDGVSNGIEFFVGATGTSFTALPSVVVNAGVKTVTWPKSAGFTGSYQVQVSSDLSSWTAAPGGTVTDNGTTVVFTFPSGPTARFVRLVVTPN